MEISWSMVAIRALHIAACMEIAAVFAIRIFVIAPVEAATLPIHWHWHRVAVWSWIISFLSWLAWLWWSTAEMSGASLLATLLNLPIFKTTLLQTHFGTLWMARLGVMLAFGPTLFIHRPAKGPPASPAKKGGLMDWYALTLAAALLEMLVWVGHAGAMAAMSKTGRNLLLSDTLHLLAAGCWPAGLLPLAFFLAAISRQFKESGNPVLLTTGVRAARRFSALSLIMVSTLALTGTANSIYLVGSFTGLTGTAYGRTLLLKLLLIFATVCLGAWNNLILKSKVVFPLKQSVGDREMLLGLLRRNVQTELFLGAGVVLAVGLLGILPPATH